MKLPEGVSLVLLLGIFAVAGLNWSTMPATIPTHYNALGEADHWGPKARIWVLPVVGAGLYLLMTVVASLAAAGKVNVPLGINPTSAPVRRETAHMLSSMKVLVMATFGYIVWRQTMFPQNGLGLLFLPVMLFAPLALVVVYMLRVRRANAT